MSVEMMKVACAILIAMLTTVHSARAQSPPGSGPALVKAQLLADTDVVVPGKPFTLGVLLDVAPGWHVYWSNPGDAGLPTQIHWNLPAGLTTGVTRYPLPVRFTQAGDIVGYGYQNRLLLTTVVTPASDLKPGTALDLAAGARWLVCEKVCIPGKANVSLPLVVGPTSSPANAEVFSKLKSDLPVEFSESKALRVVNAKFDPAASVTTLHLQFQDTPAVTSVEFFPGPSDAVEIRDVQMTHEATEWVLRLPVKFESDADRSPKLFGLVVFTTSAGERGGVNVEIPIK